jgi:uncharacterized membrane protein YsdA (DUF1294 family)
MIGIALVALTVANLAAFGLFAFDKQRARGRGSRIPERTLLVAALFGGPGAWVGQHALRHKTRKEPFRSRLGFVLVLHGVALAAGAVWAAGVRWPPL